MAIGCIPTHAAYFSIYEIAKLKFNVQDDKVTPFKSALVGVTSVFFHDLIMNPFDGMIFVVSR